MCFSRVGCRVQVLGGMAEICSSGNGKRAAAVHEYRILDGDSGGPKRKASCQTPVPGDGAWQQHHASEHRWVMLLPVAKAYIEQGSLKVYLQGSYNVFRRCCMAIGQRLRLPVACNVKAFAP